MWSRIAPPGHKLDATSGQEHTVVEQEHAEVGHQYADAGYGLDTLGIVFLAIFGKKNHKIV